MSDIKWIKITTGMFDDEKIKIIETLPEKDSILIIWIKLLTLAGKVNDNGYIYFSEDIPYTDEMLATILNRPLNTVRLALETFKKFHMIITDEKGIYIQNFEKHQNIEGMERVRELTRARVAKFREKQQKCLSLPMPLEPLDDSCNVTVAFGNATDKIRSDQNRIDNNINIIIVQIFNFWNEQKIKIHKKITDQIKREISNRVKDYGVDLIKQSILNYSKIINNPDSYWFGYRWDLKDFLHRGLEKFMDWEVAHKNYMRDKQNNGHKKGVISGKFSEGNPWNKSESRL